LWQATIGIERFVEFVEIATFDTLEVEVRLDRRCQRADRSAMAAAMPLAPLLLGFELLFERL
jgi:hypothetical protein